MNLKLILNKCVKEIFIWILTVIIQYFLESEGSERADSKSAFVALVFIWEPMS